MEVELLEEITIKHFFLQVKSAILKDEIYCPPDTCVLLASYALQARYGDYVDEINVTNGFFTERLLPERYVVIYIFFDKL